MALSGKLEADFSEFYDACARAVTSLASLGEAAGESAKNLAEADKGVEGLGASLAKLASGVASGELLKDAFEKVLDVTKELLTAIPDLVTHTIDLGNNLYEMSLKTGASVENLSALRYVASQVGMDFNSFGTILPKMEQNLGATGNAADKLQGHLDALHLNLTTLKNEKPDQAFIDIMSGLEQIPSRADQAAIGVAVFGRGFKEMAGLTQESIQTMMQEAHNLGLVMSTETAAAAHAAEVGFKSLQMQLESVGTHIAAAFLPALVGLEQNLGTMLKGAIDSTNASLDKMGGSGGFLQTVAAAMGTGDKAIAAQNQLYEYLKNAIIDVVRYGIEPLITGFSLLMQTWDEALILGKAIVLGYQGITYAIEGVLYYTNKLAQYTDPFNAAAYKKDAETVGTAMNELYDKMAKGDAEIEQLKKNQTDWAATGTATNKQIESSLTALAATHSHAAETIEDYAERSKKAYGGVSTVATDTGEKLKGFAKTLADLTLKIDEANNHNLSYAEKLELFGSAAAKAALEAKALGIAVSDGVQDMADAFNQAAIDKIFAKWDSETKKIIDKFVDNWQKGQQKIADGTAKMLAGDLKLYEEFADKNAALAMTATERELAGIEKERKARTDALGVRTEQDATYYDLAKAQIDAYYDHAVAVANKSDDTIEERLAAQGIYTQEQLDAQAEAYDKTYWQMVADGNYTAQQLNDAAKRSNDAWAKAAGDIERTWSQTFTSIATGAQQLGSAIGAVANAVGGSFGKMASAASKAFTDVSGGIKDIVSGLTSGNIIGEIAGITSGIVKLGAAAVNAAKSLFGFGNAGRDAVVKFADSMGGFDALHEKLNALGAEGEKLWITLTQGVGKNNPQQAQAAIQAVTDALNKQTAAQSDTTQVTEVQALATIETATQASAALDTVTQKLKDNAVDWQTWGDAVNGIINSVGKAVVAMPTPSAPSGVPGFATGTGGQYLNFGSGTLAMLHGNERIMTAGEGAGGGGGTAVIQLDGRTIAEAVVPQMPGVIQRYGLVP